MNECSVARHPHRGDRRACGADNDHAGVDTVASTGAAQYDNRAALFHNDFRAILERDPSVTPNISWRKHHAEVASY